MNSPTKGLLEHFERVNVNRFLKLRLVEQHETKATIALSLITEYSQETGIIHGGIITTLADTACVYTFWPVLSADEMPSSIEFKVNFLNAAFVDKGELVAKARAIKIGKAVIVSEAEVYQGDKIIAKGIFTYLRFKRKGA